MNASIRLSVLLLSAAAAGCGPESWAPPAPAGVTWRYDHLGYHDRSTTVVTGSIRGPAAVAAYGGAFVFREEVGPALRNGTDPFAESTPIDGVRFNEHLAGQGRKLEAAPPPASSTTVAPGPP